MSTIKCCVPAMPRLRVSGRYWSRASRKKCSICGKPCSFETYINGHNMVTYKELYGELAPITGRYGEEYISSTWQHGVMCVLMEMCYKNIGDKDMDVAYRIRSPEGTYSNGKTKGFKWVKKSGKVFPNKAHLSSHLYAMLNRGLLDTYKGCTLVQVKMKDNETWGMDELIHDMSVKRFHDILVGDISC